MSSYGPPPGGGYPPQEPGPPIDPWGQPAYPSSPGYGPPQGYSGYQPSYEPSWQPAPPPPPPQKNSRQTVLIVVIVVLALLLGVAGFTAFWLTNRDKPTKANPGTTPTEQVTTTAPAPTSAGPRDFRAVAKGECVVNDGTDKDPKLRIVPCAKNTLLVLERINATTDRSKCATVKGYEFFFFYDSTLDSLDFVLCMKKSS